MDPSNGVPGAAERRGSLGLMHTYRIILATSMVASQFRKKTLNGHSHLFDTLEMLCGRASVKFSNGPDQNFTIFANFAIHNLALKVAFSTFFAKKRTNARKRTDWSLVPTQMRKTCVGYHFQDIDMLTAKLQTQIGWRANFSRRKVLLEWPKQALLHINFHKRW